MGEKIATVNLFMHAGIYFPIFLCVSQHRLINVHINSLVSTIVLLYERSNGLFK